MSLMCCFHHCSLKPLDIAFMKAVHHKVNIVPVIAKADTLTRHEVNKLKNKVLGLQIEFFSWCAVILSIDLKELNKVNIISIYLMWFMFRPISLSFNFFFCSYSSALVANKNYLCYKWWQLCFTQILEEVGKLGIHTYRMPDCDSDEDEDYKEQCQQLKVSSIKLHLPPSCHLESDLKKLGLAVI